MGDVVVVFVSLIGVVEDYFVDCGKVEVWIVCGNGLKWNCCKVVSVDGGKCIVKVVDWCVDVVVYVYVSYEIFLGILSLVILLIMCNVVLVIVCKVFKVMFGSFL